MALPGYVLARSYVGRGKGTIARQKQWPGGIAAAEVGSGTAKAKSRDEMHGGSAGCAFARHRSLIAHRI